MRNKWLPYPLIQTPRRLELARKWPGYTRYSPWIHPGFPLNQPTRGSTLAKRTCATDYSVFIFIYYEIAVNRGLPWMENPGSRGSHSLNSIHAQIRVLLASVNVRYLINLGTSLCLLIAQTIYSKFMGIVVTTLFTEVTTIFTVVNFINAVNSSHSGRGTVYTIHCTVYQVSANFLSACSLYTQTHSCSLYTV